MTIPLQSIEEKVGALFIASFDGDKLNGEMMNLITTYHIGGVCLIGNAVKNPKQLHKLSMALQHYADPQSRLFLATYQNELTNGMTISPGQQQIGQLNNRLYTKQMTEMIGAELRTAGITVTIAPNLDVSEEEHAFGNNPVTVARHGIASIQGYRKEKIVAAAMMDHFIDAIYDDWHHAAIGPSLFGLIKALEAIVLSSDYLVQHPERVIFLRETLGYDGIIIATCTSDETEHILQTISSGANMILAQTPYHNQLQMINSVVEAAKNGEVLTDQLHQSIAHIMRIKQAYNVGDIAPFQRDAFLKKRATSFVEKLNNLTVHA